MASPAGNTRAKQDTCRGSKRNPQFRLDRGELDKLIERSAKATPEPAYAERHYKIFDFD